MTDTLPPLARPNVQAIRANAATFLKPPAKREKLGIASPNQLPNAKASMRGRSYSVDAGSDAHAFRASLAASGGQIPALGGGSIREDEDGEQDGSEDSRLPSVRSITRAEQQQIQQFKLAGKRPPTKFTEMASMRNLLSPGGGGSTRDLRVASAGLINQNLNPQVPVLHSC